MCGSDRLKCDRQRVPFDRHLLPHFHISRCVSRAGRVGQLAARRKQHKRHRNQASGIEITFRLKVKENARLRRQQQQSYHLKMKRPEEEEEEDTRMKKSKQGVIALVAVRYWLMSRVSNDRIVCNAIERHCIHADSRVNNV